MISERAGAKRSVADLGWARANLRSRWIGTLVVVGLAGGTLLACEDDDPAAPVHEHAVATLQIQPSTLALTTGASSTLQATARCGCGAVVSETVAWSSEDSGVVTVSSDGALTAVSFGTARVRAAAGGVEAWTTVTVLPEGTVVGPTGGTVVSAGGGLVLDIDAGALTVPTDIVVETVADATFAGDPFFVPGTAFRLRPGGLQFQLSARLRIRYDADHLPPGIDPERLRLRQRTQDGWAETTQHQHRVQTREVEGRVAGLGTFALVAVPEGVWVGPAGATVTAAEGAVELEVPAGALDGWTDVVLAPASDPPFLGDPAFVAGTAWSVGPEGLQLHERARLRIRYDPDAVPLALAHDRLRIRERDRVQDRWDATPDNEVHQAQRRVEARIERFGLFAIVGEPLGSLIGPEGGRLVAGAGALEIIVPEGALDAVVDLTATAVDDARFATDPLFVPGTAWQLMPEGLQFRHEVTVRLRYDPQGLPPGVTPERLRLRVRDDDAHQWRETRRNRVRLQEHVIEGEVSHFSTFALVGVPVAQGPVASVTVLPSTWVLEAGEAIQLTADVRDVYDNPLVRPVVWTTSDATVATVDDTGIVQALAEGDVVIRASVDGVQGAGVGQVRKGKAPVATVTVVPATLSLAIGDIGTLMAELRDADGLLLVDRPVAWTTADRTVAVVDHTGRVTAIAAGSTTITAASEGVRGDAVVVVAPPISRLEIADPGHEPLEIGFTKQLQAVAYDQGGAVIDLPIRWSSGDESMATVDATGLVTAVGRGVVTISAHAAGLTASVDIRIVGEGGAYGNNLSWPVVFADGVGITGLPVATDPGIRPTPTENVTVTALPFFWDQNAPTYGDVFYEQQTFNTWVAQWIDGSTGAPVETTVTWGDNLTHQTWSVSRPIRVEQVLSAPTVGTLVGFQMTYLFGQGPNEMQGTDGTTAEFVPTVYTVGPTLTVERIEGPGGAVLGTAVSEPVGSEVNVVGKIIYGYNLRLSDWTPPAGVSLDGWYRLTFAAGSGAHVAIVAVGNTGDELVYVPQVDPGRNLSWIEILVNP